MRRWNLLFVAAPLAAMLIILSGPGSAIAFAPNSTNFKGKAAVYYPHSGPYFVVNFTCSGGHLSGKWTFETNTNGASYSGTLDDGTCSFNSGTSDITATTVSCTANCDSATLSTLKLSNVSATKTYVGDVMSCTSAGPEPCIEIIASATAQGVVHDFNSHIGNSFDPPYGTLTIQLPKS